MITLTLHFVKNDKVPNCDWNKHLTLISNIEEWGFLFVGNVASSSWSADSLHEKNQRRTATKWIWPYVCEFSHTQYTLNAIWYLSLESYQHNSLRPNQINDLRQHNIDRFVRSASVYVAAEKNIATEASSPYELWAKSVFFIQYFHAAHLAVFRLGEAFLAFLSALPFCWGNLLRRNESQSWVGCRLEDRMFNGSHIIMNIHAYWYVRRNLLARLSLIRTENFDFQWLKCSWRLRWHKFRRNNAWTKS